MMTNNVIRLLDSRKISYRAFELPDQEKRSATETAQILGVSPEVVYKTIVVIRNGKAKPCLVVVPATAQVDLKAIASLLGEKKVSLSTLREAEKLTGLKSGGISPLALINRGFFTLLDQSAEKFSEIHISGGQRGLNIRLPVADLIALTQAKIGNISMPL